MRNKKAKLTGYMTLAQIKQAKKVRRKAQTGLGCHTQLIMNSNSERLVNQALVDVEEQLDSSYNSFVSCLPQSVRVVESAISPILPLIH